MGLQDIINTIIEDANKEEEKIKAEYTEKQKEIEEKGKKTLIAEKKKIDKDIEQEVRKIIERAKLESNIEERNQIVEAKQKLVDEAFSNAIDKIKNLDDSQHIKILLSLINNLPDTDVGIIIPASGGKELVKSALEQSNKSFALSEEDEFDAPGGFIFKSSDIEVNNSYKELLKGLREDLEIEISKKMFA